MDMQRCVSKAAEETASHFPQEDNKILTAVDRVQMSYSLNS